MSNDADTVRTMIQNENELHNHRMGWFVTCQALLFAGLAVAWKDARELIPWFCCLGLGISLVAYATVVFAVRAVFDLVDWWARNKLKDYQGPPVWGGMRDHVRRASMFVTPVNLLPLLFIAAWVGVFLVSR